MTFLQFSSPFTTVRLASTVLLLMISTHSFAASQANTTQSSCTLSPAQIESAGISAPLALGVEAACNFEHSEWTNGSVTFDDFYNVPSHISNALPGTLLKVEQDANTSAYNLPPNTALSRIIIYISRFQWINSTCFCICVLAVFASNAT